MKIKFDSGWVISTFDSDLGGPVALCEEKGMTVEVDRDCDVEVTRETDYAGHVSTYIPLVVLERLIMEHRAWLARRPS